MVQYRRPNIPFVGCPRLLMENQTVDPLPQTPKKLRLTLKGTLTASKKLVIMLGWRWGPTQSSCIFVSLIFGCAPPNFKFIFCIQPVGFTFVVVLTVVKHEHKLIFLTQMVYHNFQTVKAILDLLCHAFVSSVLFVVAPCSKSTTKGEDDK